jgi:hypothetical protein
MAEPHGIRFWDMASNQELLLVGDGQPYSGWLLYRHVEGHWVTLRKATPSDIDAIADAPYFASYPGFLGPREWLEVITCEHCGVLAAVRITQENQGTLTCGCSAYLVDGEWTQASSQNQIIEMPTLKFRGNFSCIEKNSW